MQLATTAEGERFYRRALPRARHRPCWLPSSDLGDVPAASVTVSALRPRTTYEVVTYAVGPNVVSINRAGARTP
jgi:hypothetical protein